MNMNIVPGYLPVFVINYSSPVPIRNIYNFGGKFGKGLLIVLKVTYSRLIFNREEDETYVMRVTEQRRVSEYAPVILTCGSQFDDFHDISNFSHLDFSIFKGL